MRGPTNPPKVGEIYENNKFGAVTVVEYKGCTDVIVRFSDGNLKSVSTAALRRGRIKNDYHPSVCGVGFVGVGRFSSKVPGGRNSRHEYDVWRCMLRRCYDERSWVKYPTYRGCTVHPDWHNFQNFAEWYTSQPRYLDNWHIDKDYMVPGNTIYSSKTCTLLPPEINSIMSGSGKADRGQYPIGVHWCKSRKSFVSQIRRGRGEHQEILGTFKTAGDAFNAYKCAKEKHIKDVLTKYVDEIPSAVYNNLYNHEVKITD